MSDIVERLRLRRDPLTDGERAEAADEIDRLRRLLNTACRWHAQFPIEQIMADGFSDQITQEEWIERVKEARESLGFPRVDGL